MADRACAEIKIGGSIRRSCIEGLIGAIQCDGGRADWDGEPLGDDALSEGEMLEAFAYELSGGIFQEAESFCEEHGLPYVRSSGSCAGAFGPERVVFTGEGTAAQFDLTEQDEVALTRCGLLTLGSMQAAESWFASAEFVPPPFTIIEDGATSKPACELCHG